LDRKALKPGRSDMAKTMSVVVTDDLDGSPDAETVAFGFDAAVTRLDLGKKNRARLQKVAAAVYRGRPQDRCRRTAKAPRAAGSRTGRAAVRAWGRGQGLKVSERGRISAEVMTRYDAAH